MTDYFTDLSNDLGDDFLRCAACLGNFKNPKIIPCFHTFCEPCLQTMLKENKGRLICPTCRQLWQLPSDMVSKLDDNTFMSCVLDLVKKGPESKEEQSSTCELCEDAEATHICVECQQTCCVNCQKVHKRTKITSGHSVLTLGEYKETKAKNPSRLQQRWHCDVHTDSQVAFFCDTCQVPVCTACTVINHRAPDHVHRDLAEVTAGFSERLSTIVKEMKAKAKEARESRAVARSMCDEANRLRQDGRKKVTMEMEAKIEKARAEGEKLLQEIDNACENICKDGELKVGHMNFKYGNLVSMCSYLDEVIRRGNMPQLIATAKDASGHIGDLLKTATTSKTGSAAHFELPLNTLDVLKSDVCVSKCSVEDLPPHIRGSDNVTFYVKTRDSSGRDVIPRQEVSVKLTRPMGSQMSLKVYHNVGVQTVHLNGSLATGKCSVFVDIDGEPVPGSPFEIDFLSSPDTKESQPRPAKEPSTPSSTQTNTRKQQPTGKQQPVLKFAEPEDDSRYVKMLSRLPTEYVHVVAIQPSALIGTSDPKSPTSEQKIGISQGGRLKKKGPPPALPQRKGATKIP
ncbi:tripartite motif-containing protein 3-like [Ptychodera flava]|uniref:tripartite motif-containing protein 3-like n=1 Tax=Ptychodera flava TaxID=63121 RepID=UPI003969CA9A